MLHIESLLPIHVLRIAANLISSYYEIVLTENINEFTYSNLNTFHKLSVNAVSHQFIYIYIYIYIYSALSFFRSGNVEYAKLTCTSVLSCAVLYYSFSHYEQCEKQINKCIVGHIKFIYLVYPSISSVLEVESTWNVIIVP